MYVKDRHHVYGGRIALCPFYNEYFDLQQVPYWRSVGSRDDVDEVISRYFAPLPEVNSDLVESLYTVLSELDIFIQPVTPLSSSEANNVLPSNTSPGFPYSKNGIRTKGDCKDKILRDYEKGLDEAIRTRRFDIPCLAGLRLALAKKPKNKPRIVWVYPAVVQLAEAKYFMPIYKQLFHCKYFSWDFSFLRGEYEEIRYWLNSSSCHFGCDVSSFDATVSSTLINIIFDWIQSKFVMTWQQVREFNAIRNYFIETPLWYQNDIFYTRRGVPSGSFFTQLVDSIVNLAYQLYFVREALYSPYLKLKDVFSFIRVLGDDSLAGIDPYFAYRMTAKRFAFGLSKLAESGVEAHPEKGYFVNRITRETINQPEFLGFRFFLNSMRVLPVLSKDPELVHAQCLFPESEEKDPGFAYARLVGIKWSTGDDPESLAIVNDYFDLLTKRFPNITPGSLPREYAHLFTYVFGRLKIDPSYYPSDNEVINRYRSRNLAGSSGVNYHRNVLLTHKVADLKRLSMNDLS